MFLDKGARGSRPSAVHEQPRRIMERAPARHAAPPPRTAAGQTAEGDLLVVPPAHGTARKRRVARGQRDDRRTTRAPLPAGMGEKPAEHARDVRAYRNFCGAYNRGPALWEQACRPVIFVAWKMMRPRWWAGWRENAIQQSEEMPRVRACDEEERADRQGRPAVEMPGLPVELDDAAAAAQAGADAGGVPFLAAGAVIPKGGGLRGRRPRPAQTNRMVLAHPPAHRPAGRQAPHGHGGRHVHGPRLVPDHRHRRASRRGAGLAVVRARVCLFNRKWAV